MFKAHKAIHGKQFWSTKLKKFNITKDLSRYTSIQTMGHCSCNIHFLLGLLFLPSLLTEHISLSIMKGTCFNATYRWNKLSTFQLHNFLSCFFFLNLIHSIHVTSQTRDSFIFSTFFYKMAQYGIKLYSLNGLFKVTFLYRTVEQGKYVNPSELFQKSLNENHGKPWYY